MRREERFSGIHKYDPEKNGSGRVCQNLFLHSYYIFLENGLNSKTNTDVFYVLGAYK